MGILTTLLGGTERRASPSIWDDYWYQPILSGAETTAGLTVTNETVQQISPVFAGMRVSAETLATIPLILYRSLSENTRERATDHPLYNLLHLRPNAYQTSTEWREQMQSYFALWGKAASEIIRDNGRPIELHTIHPDRIRRSIMDSGTVYYQILTRSGQWEPWTMDRVLYLEAFGGRSPMQLARNSMGLTLATERHGARFFANDATPSGVLQSPAALSDKAYKRLEETWKKKHQGVDRSHGLAILEEGTVWNGISVSAEDAQLLETRRFQVEEVARWFNIPPHLLQDLSRATFSNIEHKSREFIDFSMRPWFVRWEQALSRDLISPEDGSLYVEFLADALIRGDIATRYSSYQVAINNGWLSPNDVRRLENMNPIEGGDQYFIPLNLVPLSRAEEFIDIKATEVPSDNSAASASVRMALRAAKRSMNRRRQICEASRPTFQDIGTRIVRRETNDIRRAMKKHLRSLESFERWLREFYEEYSEVVTSMSLPAFMTFGELIYASASEEINVETALPEEFIRAYAEKTGGQYASSSLYQLLDIIENSGVDKTEDLLLERLDEWEESRPSKYSERAVWEGGSAIAKAVFVSGGVTYLRWVANAEACDLCVELDGQVVGVEAPFVPAGGTVDPQNGVTTPLTSSKNVSHPQLHQGCQCMIVPDAGAQ